MKESIYTIPISEVFEPKCGCPLCSLNTKLESRWVEYITGAAMMEPDVRTETNKHGFCSRHFDMMLLQRNRLSVALMLQSRLEYIGQTLCEPPAHGVFTAKAAATQVDSCFICQKLNGEFSRICGNIAALWARDADFQSLYSQQEYLCYPHYRMLWQASAKLRAPQAKAFLRESAALTLKKLLPLKENVDSFCNLFDYRNAGSQRPDKQISGAIEAAICYLTSVEDKKES